MSALSSNAINSCHVFGGDSPPEYIRQLQNSVRQRVDIESLKRIAVLSNLHNMDTAQNRDAILYTSSLLGIPVSEIMAFQSEFSHDPESFILPPADHHNVKHSKRTWLLEEYPDRYNRAKQWVDRNLAESVSKHGKLFRIIDFQHFVNTELLVDLFEGQKKKIESYFYQEAAVFHDSIRQINNDENHCLFAVSAHHK